MSVELDNILRAIHNSVIEAQKLTEEQHMRTLNRFFFHGEDGNSLDKPKMVNMKLPFGKGGRVEYEDVEVPLITLSPPSSIKIKNMKVEFEAKLTGFGEKEANKKGFSINGLFKKKVNENSSNGEKMHQGPIKLNLDGNKTGTAAKIQIEFCGTEVPETIARINDHIIKSFPF